VVLVLLVIGWAVVLLPAALRRHTERRSGDSIGDFRDHLDRLRGHGTGALGSGPLGHGRTTGSRPMPIRSLAIQQPAARHADLAVARARSRRIKKRRRDVLAGLLASMVGSALLALVPGFGALWMLHVVLDVLFAAYVVLLLRLRQGAVSMRQGVSPMPSAYAHDPVDTPLDDVDGYDYELAWSHAANE